MAISEENLVRTLLQEQLSLLAFIRAIVRDQDRADDVFQEVSVQAVRDRKKIDSQKHLVRWLRRVARHRAINAMRDSKKHTRVLAPDVLDQIEAEWAKPESLASSQALAALQRCIERLAPFAKRLLNLRYTEGLSGAEMAEVIGRSESALYMALSRIRRALGKCIREDLAEEGR